MGTENTNFKKLILNFRLRLQA